MRLSDKTRALVALAVLLTTGCTVAGNPIARYPNPAALDVGKYSIHPLEEPDGDEKSGRVVEAARMAEAMIFPTEIDPTLTHVSGSNGVRLLSTPAKATLLLAAPVRVVLERNGMLTGASVGGTDIEPDLRGPVVGAARVLSVVVLRFPDADSAQRAAREIDTVDAAVSPDNVPVHLPEYPAAHAHWRPTVPTLATTIADGPYVVSLLTGHTSADLAALTGLARKALDAQLPRLREFVATPRDAIASLPLDRDGMLARMVPEAPGRWPYPKVIVNTPDRTANWSQVVRGMGVVYGPRGTRLWNGKGQAGSEIELEAVNGMTQLARYTTATIARREFEATNGRWAADTGKRTVTGPDNVPDVYCSESAAAGAGDLLRFGCRILYGRYQGLVVGMDLANVRQRVAAQYGLLVNSG